jgi:hypothetical protein
MMSDLGCMISAFASLRSLRETQNWLNFCLIM